MAFRKFQGLNEGEQIWFDPKHVVVMHHYPTGRPPFTQVSLLIPGATEQYAYQYNIRELPEDIIAPGPE